MKPEYIFDPVYGLIIINPVLPMVDAEEFQALRQKMELGAAHFIFPEAKHDRFMHSVGSYWATANLASRLRGDSIISKEEADALAAFALYHDIGHGPLSHITEDFFDLSNSEKSCEMIKELRAPIEACGINHKLVVEFASHKNPLARAVYDKNLGMEKLDYLERDATRTILCRPGGIEQLRENISFVNGELVVHEEAAEDAMSIQNFYLQMYKNVYYEKSATIVERMIQKAVYRLILCGETSKEKLAGMVDPELLSALHASGDSFARKIYAALRKRKFFKEAVVLRPEEFARVTPTAGRFVTVFGISKDETKLIVDSPLLQKRSHEELAWLENEIAALAGLPENSVIVVPIFHPEKFQAQDILLYGDDGRLRSLRELRPAHFADMEETARSYLALRICTLPEHREALSSPQTAKKIFDFVMNTMGRP